MIQHPGSGVPGAPLIGDILVFVYGTLLRGEAHHSILGSARFVGEATTAPEYTLANMGDFPALVEGGEQAVTGEVYAIGRPTLDILDELEDHPRYYCRTKITLADGTEVQTYLLSAARAAGHAAIASGDWRERDTATLA